MLVVSDTVKPTSAEAIAELRRLGLRPVLLTGDNPRAAAAVAAQVGIEEVIAGVLPAGKVQTIRELQAAGRVVAMVGDGVNDAAALAQSDLGLAMGTGTDVAIEASDLTLVRGDLRTVPEAIALSRRTLRTIEGNLFWAFAYNAAALPLAALGFLNPLIAGAAMAFSSVFVVSNSLRLRSFRSGRARRDVKPPAGCLEIVIGGRGQRDHAPGQAGHQNADGGQADTCRSPASIATGWRDGRARANQVGIGLARSVVPLASPSRSSPGPASSRNWLLTRQNLGADRLRRMAALPGRTGDDRIAGEQAALRRVATLVARAAPPEEVFAAVTEEAGRLLGADYATMARYDPDGTRTVVAAWSSTGAAFPVGSRARLGGRNVPTLVFQTGRPARIDDYAGASGPIAEAAREFGFRAAVGVPVSVEGRLWGVMIVGSREGRCRPAPRRGWPGSPSWPPPRSPTPRPAWNCAGSPRSRPRCGGWRRWWPARRRRREVLTAVTEEAGRLLDADHAAMDRYDPDGAITVVATWSSTGRCLPRRHPVEARRAERARRWCSRRAGRRGSTTTPAPRARSPRPPASSASARRSACRSASRGGCGASWSWDPARGRCRPAPRRGWPGSPSWPPPRSPTPRPRPP